MVAVCLLSDTDDQEATKQCIKCSLTWSDYTEKSGWEVFEAQSPQRKFGDILGTGSHSQKVKRDLWANEVTIYILLSRNLIKQTRAKKEFVLQWLVSRRDSPTPPATQWKRWAHLYTIRKNPTHKEIISGAKHLWRWDALDPDYWLLHLTEK